MLNKKTEMGEDTWIANHDEVGPMYAYVLNSLTFDYQCNSLLDLQMARKLQPAVRFLQDELIFYLRCREEFADDDELVNIQELLTTMEAIIQICHASEANGIDEEVNSGFMNHERAEELIKGLVKIYLEQLDTLFGLV